MRRLPLEERRKNILRAIPHLTGGRDVIKEARGLVRNARSVEALDHLEEIYSIFEKLDLARHLTIDLGEVRGFDYYTGILFRAYVPQLGFEVATGGRYDGLPATFGEDLPAVGFSFSLDRLEQIATPKLTVSDIGCRRMSTETPSRRRCSFARDGQGGEAVLVIALAKGRLLDNFAGSCSQVPASAFRKTSLTSRKLIFDAQDGKHRVVLVKPADVPTYVEYGAADAGIAGRDVVHGIACRSGSTARTQFRPLQARGCRAGAASSLSGSDHPTVRVATKYPHITMEYFNARGIPVEIIYLVGLHRTGTVDRSRRPHRGSRGVRPDIKRKRTGNCGSDSRKFCATGGEPRRLSDEARLKY